MEVGRREDYDRDMLYESLKELTKIYFLKNKVQLKIDFVGNHMTLLPGCNDPTA